jgi:hypothetical protein
MPATMTRRWAIVMRPQIMPPDGSPVHDELIYHSAEDAKQAIRFAYTKYERKHWYVLDVYIPNFTVDNA